MTLGMLEGPDLIIVLVIVMVMFGAKKLPELARGLGLAKREFEQAISGKDDPVTVAKTPTASQTPAGETHSTVSLAPASSPAQAETSGSVTLSRDEYERLRRLDHPTPSEPGRD